MSALEHVFQPSDLNRLRARNRVFVPAHTTNFGTTIYSNTLTFSRWREKKIRIRTLRRSLAFVDGRLVLEDVSSCGEVERLTGIDTLIACIPLGPRTRSKRRSSRWV